MKNDFLPTATLQRLVQRAKVIQQLRRFFDQRSFLEVETPILSRDTCVDRHLQPIGVNRLEIVSSSNSERADRTEGSLEKFWLQTSPEFGMKRLLAAGATAIYQITKSFRAGERGRLHNPEFTMLEWYRTGDDLQTGMDYLAELVGEMLDFSAVTRISYRELFLSELSLDPHLADLQTLQQLCRKYGVEPDRNAADVTDRDFWLNVLLTHAIEPNLGFEQPTIVFDWPASQSALALIRDGDPPVAERFELYVRGMEIANGYHELLDAEELERRNIENNRLRANDGNAVLPAASRLLAAMRNGIPACAGVALGVDRLVMLMTESESIEEVLTFPIERA